MKDYDDIEKEFIKQQLEKHADYLAELYSKDIAKKNLKKTGKLETTFASSAKFKIQGESLMVSFPNYGRFIEINFHKKKKKISTQKNSRSPFKKQQKQKNTNWYTRNSYGALNRLEGRLMFGLSEKIREKIINDLKLKNDRR